MASVIFISSHPLFSRAERSVEIVGKVPKQKMVVEMILYQLNRGKIIKLTGHNYA